MLGAYPAGGAQGWKVAGEIWFWSELRGGETREEEKREWETKGSGMEATVSSSEIGQSRGARAKRGLGAPHAK